MRRVVFVAIVLLAVACGNAKKTKAMDESVPSVAKDRVEVLYFHGKQRCMTCNAIEKLSKEVVDSLFAREVKAGKVVYRTIDISKKENEELANKYEVTWSSLFVNQWKEGKESPHNMTDFAFTTATSSPDAFKEGVRKKVQELLE